MSEKDQVVTRLDQVDDGTFWKIELKRKPAKGPQTLEQQEDLKPWLHVLLDDHYKNEAFADFVHYRLETTLPLPEQPMHGAAGTASPAQVSFLYLDVGAWVGSEHKPWGKEVDKYGDKPNLKRDFGIVCGPLVALCSFELAYKGGDCQKWNDANKKEEPFLSVDALLHELSAASPQLGKAVVRDLKIANPAFPRWPKNPKKWVIHVIVGDMHIPVLETRISTYGNAEQVKVGSFKAGPPGHVEDLVQVSLPERVPRLGRVDIGMIEPLVKLFVGPNDKDGTKFLNAVVALASSTLDLNLPLRVGAAVVLTPPLLAAIASSLGISAALLSEAFQNAKPDTEGLEKDTMTTTDAERWFEYYREPKEGRSADIFEDAGGHFLSFMRGLVAYKAGAAHNRGIPIKFLQLGDMLDFWVGFTCHYDASMSPDTPISKLDKHAEKMVKTWAENLFGNTSQGKLVAEAIKLADALTPVYLYGNHDNYLGAQQLSIQYPLKGKPEPLGPRLPRYNEHGVFMEHGHQWEPSNADSKGVSSTAGLFTGTPSPLGLFVTQAAFIRPGPVRLFEGKAAGAMARFSGTYGQRMDQIVGAVRRYVNHDFYCYVMGHTHSACLSEIVVSTRQRDRDYFIRQEAKHPQARLYFKVNDRPIPGKKVFFIGSEKYGPENVRVEWEHMMGMADDEWVSLEDYHAPAWGSFSKATKGLAQPNKRGKQADHAVFERVPPGLYIARFYLGREGQKPFKETAMTPFAVRGISVAGDPHNLERPVFEFNRKFSRDIFIRWAFDHPRMNVHSFFVVHPANELPQLDQVSTAQPHLTIRFSDIGGTWPACGRFCLTQRYPESFDPRVWDSEAQKKPPYGVWKVSAFMDPATPCGSATFEVREAKK